MVHADSAIAFVFNVITFMQLLSFLYDFFVGLLFFIDFIKAVGKITPNISLKQACNPFLTGCLQFNYHFIKWLTKL